MDKFIVHGPCQLQGTVEISAAKNSVLKLIAASLLVPGEVRLKNIPKLNDIKTMLKLLTQLGASVQHDGSDVVINCAHVKETKAHYDIVRTMRASILVLGPLLARFGHGYVSLPGGCAIGARPIDMHLAGLKQLGAQIEMFDGYVVAKAEGLKGAVIELPFPSVGATENILMAAIFAKGKTLIKNAAREPEITDLANFLKNIFPGLEISGLGTSEITITGIDKNSPFNKISYTPVGDRIEALTMIMAAAATTQSEVRVLGFNPEHLGSAYDVLKNMNVNMEKINSHGVVVKHSPNLKAVHVITEPYPGFPTDAQAQLVVLCLKAQGESHIEETIFENRFMHVPELMRMNANLHIKGNKVSIMGGGSLVAAPVMCTDLRASAALVMASLLAKGITTISRVYHLDRGYDALEKKLSQLGAKIERVNE
jgi:UDP-N-acetylglucosamine 1-carboxyvinyltransferase